jgi:hypothetical protein
MEWGHNTLLAFATPPKSTLITQKKNIQKLNLKFNFSDETFSNISLQCSFA